MFHCSSGAPTALWAKLLTGYGPVVQYLSDEWFSAATEAIATAGALPGPCDLTVHQRVDDLTWSVRFFDQRAELLRTALSSDTAVPRDTALSRDTALPRDTASDGGADSQVSFSQTRDVANSIGSGQRDAHEAFLLGDVVFDGDVELLIKHRAVFDWLESALAPLMAITTFT